MISTLARLEVHGPEAELEKLREPLAALDVRFFNTWSTDSASGDLRFDGECRLDVRRIFPCGARAAARAE